MSDLLDGITIGMVTGVASGVASWWVITRLLRPRLRLDPKLSYYLLDGESVPRSQARVTVGRRAVVELTVTITLRMPDLIRPRSVEMLRVFRSESPYVNADGALRWRISIHRMPEETYKRFRRWLGPWQEAIAGERPIDVKAFLAEHPRSQVVVTITARDAYTGSPTAVQLRYGLDDFLDGEHPRTKRKRHRSRSRRPAGELPALGVRWLGWSLRWCADEFRAGWDAANSEAQRKAADTSRR